MSKPIFTPLRDAFNAKNDAFKDMMQAHMAMDIEVVLKTTAGMPVSNTKASGNRRGGGGHMKAATRHFKTKMNQWRVEINKEYAAVQEAGVRLTGKGAPAVMQNYSTPGTSHHFFARAIESVVKKKESYAKEASRALNL